MGREEEKKKSTRFVPASVCWLCYILASVWLLSVLLLFPQHEDHYWNSMMAHCESTVQRPTLTVRIRMTPSANQVLSDHGFDRRERT